MHRSTENRCSWIVDEAERKRLAKKSRARMAAVRSPMKIVPPKKANKNTKKIIERRAREQRLALENFHMLERLKRASAKSSLNTWSKMSKYKKQFKHNKSKIRQLRLQAVVEDNIKIAARLVKTPSTIKTESMDRDYYNHVHVMSRMRDIKTTEGFHGNLIPPPLEGEGAVSPGTLAYTWRPKSTAKLRDMPPDIFAKPRGDPAVLPRSKLARNKKGHRSKVKKKVLKGYAKRRSAGEFMPERQFKKEHAPAL